MKDISLPLFDEDEKDHHTVAIRPGITVFALGALIVGYFGHFSLDEGTRATLCFIVSSWFGTSSTFQIGKKA